MRDRLYAELTVEWPLIELERPDRRVFPELSDEELSELERSQSFTREPEDDDDEEMKKDRELIPEK